VRARRSQPWLVAGFGRAIGFVFNREMRSLGGLVCALTFAAACAGGAPRVDGEPRPVAPSSGSNVLRGDYAGSRACAECHQAIYAAWQSSPMRRMTRAAATADIHAPFGAGAALHVGGDVARLEQQGGAKLVVLDHPAGAREMYRVTKVLGGRTREDFVGVRVDSPSGAALGEEEVLPVSYLLFDDRLRYKGYSVMLHERHSLEAGPPWAKNCILCHNTAPYFTTLERAFAGRRAKAYQGALVDDTLPRDRALHYRVSDDAALERALSSELHALGGEPRGEVREDVVATIDATRSQFGERDLVEVGIGCEACHGGSSAHVHDPSELPTFLPRAPFFAVEPQPNRAEAVNRVCARCHQVLFSQYPWTWEGGARHENPGGSPISSGEARDFLLGGCATAMSCTSCHDPHGKDDGARLAAMYTPKGNDVCLACHAELRGNVALRAHAHHDPTGAGGACLACHMPRKNMTLDVRLGGYHRIGSPTDPARVYGDRPLECALCHAEKSVGSLASTMETWWGKRYDRSLLTKQYGDLAAPAMRAALDRGKPHEQAVALWVLGQRRQRDDAPSVARETVNEYPLVRQYAKDALDAILGRRCDVDVADDPASIERVVRGCLAASGVAPLSGPWSKAGPTADANEPAED
jgi:predicted CXXCH cytochrome family protein